MTLLEVIVALSIFTLVAFSLVMALQAGVDTGKMRTTLDHVYNGFERQQALLHAGVILPVDKDLPDDNSGIAYHLTIEQAQLHDQDNRSLSGMYRATITAKWKSNGQPEQREISQLVYQP